MKIVIDRPERAIPQDPVADGWIVAAANSALRWLWRAGGNVALGLVDQALLSGSAFVLTIVLANVLDVRAFGSFSIAWSVSILIEAVFLRGLFDDGLPAAAHRIPRSRWGEMRFGLYLSSLQVAGAIGVLLMIAGGVIAAAGGDGGGLMLATGLAVPAGRLQSMFRRIAYLDGRLPRAVVSSLTYCIVLVLCAALMVALQLASAAAAMTCIAIAAAISGSLVLLWRRELVRPQQRVLRALLWRLFRSGRWFVATSLTYWIGSIGLIPFCGLIIGLEASASLRILLLIFAPLSQFCATVFSVRLPEIAAELRAGQRDAVAAAARENVLLLGLIAFAYGAAIVLFGERVLSFLIHKQAYDIGVGSLGLMAGAIGLDAVWLGLALPLFATGQPRKFMSSRIAGLVALCCALPVSAGIWHVAGAVAAMVVSSATSVAVVMLTNYRREQP